jgi:integrase
MTCQRESDLIRMGPAQRDRNGIWCRPKKTRRRRRSFFIPLNTADALELDRWAETPISFSSTRWKKPIARHNPELYLYSPRAAAYSGNSIRARWGRWLNRTPAGKALCDRWRAWLADRVKRYEWEIDPDDARGPTIHGLRRTGILARHADGFDVDQIANDIGMSNQMVERYMRFKDQRDLQSVVAPGCALLSVSPELRYAEIEKWSKSPHKVVSSGVDRTRRALYIGTEIGGFSKTPSPISKTNGERQAKTNT